MNVQKLEKLHQDYIKSKDNYNQELQKNRGDEVLAAQFFYIQDRKNLLKWLEDNVEKIIALAKKK